MTQPNGEFLPDVPDPVYIWTFLLATPGSWQPIVVNTDRGEVRTTEELNRLLDMVAEGAGTTREYIRPMGAPICLSAEPFVDPNAVKSQLIVPDGKIIIPGRD